MGDYPGHPFRGNQYTVASYGSSWGKKYKVLDPFGNVATKNIDSEGAAWSIARSFHERVQEGGYEMTPTWQTGHPAIMAEIEARRAKVRAALRKITVLPPLDSKTSEEVVQTRRREEEAYRIEGERQAYTPARDVTRRLDSATGKPVRRR